VSDVHTGRCACGAVSYQTRGPLRTVSFCHCEACRRQSGNFVSATAIPADQLTITGAENLGEWQASDVAVRRFCRVCGSLMFWHRIGSRSVSIMAGSMDQPTELRPWGHMFTAEKGDYYDIADGLPQYPLWPERT
jgi:hypothetical protein